MSDDPDKPWRLPNAKRMTFDDMAARAQYEWQRAEDAEAEVKHQADRIEEMEAQIAAMEEGLTAVHMAGYLDGKRAAEAKLAKAVEALVAWKHYDESDEQDHVSLMLNYADAIEKTHTILAELTGGKDA